MKKFALAFIAALALAPTAQAGSLSWTVATDAGSTTFTADVSDADIARIVSAYRIAMNIPDETSDDDVKRLVIRGALDRMLAGALAIEQQQAAQAARQAVEPIVATPQ